jgi:hypothetical protein
MVASWAMRCLSETESHKGDCGLSAAGHVLWRSVAKALSHSQESLIGVACFWRFGDGSMSPCLDAAMGALSL